MHLTMHPPLGLQDMKRDARARIFKPFIGVGGPPRIFKDITALAATPGEARGVAAVCAQGLSSYVCRMFLIRRCLCTFEDKVTEMSGGHERETGLLYGYRSLSCCDSMHMHGTVHFLRGVRSRGLMLVLLVCHQNDEMPAIQRTQHLEAVSLYVAYKCILCQRHETNSQQHSSIARVESILAGCMA